MTLTVGSLFSGIGGLDLGLERAGMRVIWQSEIDPYACQVLKKHWPEVVNHGNIKEINWQEIERPDVICGGYPCQPFSQAGKRRGEEDSRHLWPWVKQAISELRPRYAILENVRGHLSLGGLSVIAELASIGYDSEWRVISAASVGANHRRDRIVIVAYPQSSEPLEQTEWERWQSASGGSLNSGGDTHTGTEFKLANPNSSHPANGGKREDVPSQDSSWGDDGSGSGSNPGQICLGSSGQNTCNVSHTNDTGSGAPRRPTYGEWAATQQGWQIKPQLGSCGCCTPMADNERQWNGEHGLKADAGQENLRRLFDGGRKTGYVGWQWWEVEPDLGRVAHGVPSRVDRLKGLGNAVVPQVAEVVGRLVVAHSCS
jgi:DNA (cytosine-5)-methyltransferase 1